MLTIVFQVADRADAVSGLSLTQLNHVINEVIKEINPTRTPRMMTLRHLSSGIGDYPTLLQTGSVSEGTNIMDAATVSDSDFMLVLTMIPPILQFCVQPVPESPGYVWLDFTLVPQNLEISWLVSDIMTTKFHKQYISAAKAKLSKYFAWNHGHQSRSQRQTCKPEVSPAVTYKYQQGKSFPYKLETSNAEFGSGNTGTKSGKRMSFLEKMANKYLPAWDIDVVPAIACGGWPREATAWRQHARQRFNQKLIQDVVLNGYHAVPKTSPGGDAELDWRLSFSLAESRIMDDWNDTEWKTFIYTKLLLKSHLQCPKDGVTSYHLKTVMLWASEVKPRLYWHSDHLADCILGILDDLIHSVTTEYLPHYFIQGCNLLGAVNTCALQEASVELSRVRKDSNCLHHKLRPLHSHFNATDLRDGKILMCYDINFSKDYPDMLNISRGMTEAVVFAAILTIEDHQLHRIDELELKAIETLLNAFIHVVQTAFDVRKKLVESSNISSSSLLETYMQDKNLRKTNKQTANDMFEQVKDEQEFEVNMKDLILAFCFEMHNTRNDKHKQRVDLFNSYVIKLSSVVTCAELNIPQVEDLCSIWQEIREISDIKQEIFINH